MAETDKEKNMRLRLEGLVNQKVVLFIGGIPSRTTIKSIHCSRTGVWSVEHHAQGATFSVHEKISRITDVSKGGW